MRPVQNKGKHKGFQSLTTWVWRTWSSGVMRSVFSLRFQSRFSKNVQSISEEQQDFWRELSLSSLLHMNDSSQNLIIFPLSFLYHRLACLHLLQTYLQSRGKCKKYICQWRSSKSHEITWIGFILLRPWMSVEDFMGIHPTVIEIFPSGLKWCTDWSTEPPAANTLTEKPIASQIMSQTDKTLR